MIHYALRCGGEHEFDGWFKDSASFDDQAQAGLLACPSCGSAAVRRALMAPRVITSRAQTPAEPAAAAPPPAPPPPSMPPSMPAPMPAPISGKPETGTRVTQGVPDGLRAVLQRIRAEVETRCDYVGPDFAEVARQIHDGAEPARPIYGEATPEEEAALAADGIDVSRIPWVPRADS